MSNIKAQDVERSIVKKFRKEIWRKFTKAINRSEEHTSELQSH